MALTSYRLEGNIAVIQMDDGKANALSDGMMEELGDGLTRAESEAGAVVLAGRPERFSGGFDLKVMMGGPDAARKLLRRGGELFMRFYGAPLPIVGACTGHAVAGGALLLLTTDVRIGASGPFRIGLNEVSIGLPVPVLAMELARDRLVGTELARATLEARMFGPDDALRVGYLDAIADPDAVIAKAKEEATRLAALSPTAYAATKKRLRGRTIDHILATLDEDLSALLSGVGA